MQLSDCLLELKSATEAVNSSTILIEELKEKNKKLDEDVYSMAQSKIDIAGSEDCDKLKAENEFFQSELVDTKMKLALLQGKPNL